MNVRLLFLGLAASGLVLGGCASAPTSPGSAPGPTAHAGPADPWRKIKQDLTADQVQTLLGKPEEVRPMQWTGAEIWVYHRQKEAVEVVPTRMRQVPVQNPRTGEMGTKDEPEYSQVRRTVNEELNLLMVDGRLVNWNGHATSDRQFE